jgi:prophage maintenance system killer protein
LKGTPPKAPDSRLISETPSWKSDASGNIELFQFEDGTTALEVHLNQDTVWLTQAQMALLFQRERSVVTKHVQNVFREGELDEKSNVHNLHIAHSDKPVVVYNLDVIISVGYRVKSKRGTQFRQWATRVLRDHIVRGYTLNEQRFREQEEKMADLRTAVGLLEKTLSHQPVGLDEARGLLKVLGDYAYALTTLDRYDHGTLAIEDTTRETPWLLTYEDAQSVIEPMRNEFGGLFGLEKDQGFKSAVATIYQTFGGDELYPSIEEKAANLLYFVVKNHAFSDGNKRIGAALFIYFLAGCGVLYREDGSKRIGDNALVALTLLIAESRPEEKDTIAKVIVSLINRRNG